MNIIKFGGSVITDKNTECCFKQKTVQRLARELHQANQPMIIVHGAGSFGHIQAKKYQLNQGFKNESQLLGFSLTHMMVQKLNSLMLTALNEQGIPAVGLPPHAMLKLNNYQPYEINYSIFDDFRELGFTPVTYGDVVLDTSLGFSICSGDLLLELLSKYYSADKVIFVMDEDGLYTSNPKSDPKAEFIAEIHISDFTKLSTTANTYADVTQGMQGKLETIQKIAEAGIDTYLLNGNINNRLYYTLIGKETKKTHIYGDKA